MDGLVALLREDAVLRMPPQPALVGGLRIARFFLQRVARGDLSRIRHILTSANGRPALTIEVRAEDGTWHPHGISLIQIENGQISMIEAFRDPALVARFGVSAGR
jgi:RNA polymerase sigma-70 factor (ECF subfamily)